MLARRDSDILGDVRDWQAHPAMLFPKTVHIYAFSSDTFLLVTAHFATCQASTSLKFA
jgi:hypothetical protein